MDIISNLAMGFGVAFSLSNVVAALAGALLGTAVGVIPGMAPSAWMAMLLPVAIALPPETGIILLAAIYYGAQYGDSMAAILVNVPSEPPAIVVARDGFKMTMAGQAGPALATAAVGAFIGGWIGLVGLAFLAPIISVLALSFGPPEFLMIALFGSLVLSRLGGSVWKGMTAFGLGALLATIGQDPLNGTTRFTFGTLHLALGIDMVPVAVGLFGIAQLISMVVTSTKERPVPKFRIRELMPSRSQRRAALPAIARGAPLGFILGSLPGPAITLATFFSYRVEAALNRGPVPVGSGSAAAVGGPKAADDAAVGGTLSPLLALGLPFTPGTVMLFAGLLLLGVQPGPSLIPDNPTIFWGLVAGMFIANLALLILNLPLVGGWVQLLRIPRPILAGAMFVLMMIGSFALRNNFFDMMVTVLAGFAGFAFLRTGYDRTLVILGMILGPVMEPALRRSLLLSHGSFSIFFTRPISLTIFLVTVLVVSIPLWQRLFRIVRRRVEDPSSSREGSQSDSPPEGSDGPRTSPSELEPAGEDRSGVEHRPVHRDDIHRSPP